MSIGELRDQINSYLVGKEEVVENVLICLLGGGHVLLEDLPGVGKTTLAKTLAQSIDCDFSRIQFTPDTLPSDVVGMSIYNMKTGDFEYHDGAVMHQIILADEINRTSPKTQASLLEAMAEQQITIDGTVKPLPQPFMVIATQNPIDFIGTYALPEAQLDRFMMRLSIGYPDHDQEIKMAKNFLSGNTTKAAKPVMSTEDIMVLREKVTRVEVNDRTLTYIENIIELTRREDRFVMGASPRALLFLVRAAQAKAYISDRDYVTPDDVKAVAVNVLHHRLALTSDAKIQGRDIDSIILALVVSAPVPTV